MDITDGKQKMVQAVEHFQEQLKGLRTGRANASMLDNVVVEAYGVPMPLNQVANISVPEAQLLQITPFDPSNLQAIAGAIRDNQSLGFNPSDDGHVVRVPIPPLTEERRRDIAKQLGAKQEDAMIAIRNIRHDLMSEVESAKKAKDVGEDDAKRQVSQIEDLVQKTRSEVEALAKAKEAEIMKV